MRRRPVIAFFNGDRWTAHEGIGESLGVGGPSVCGRSLGFPTHIR